MTVGKFKELLKGFNDNDRIIIDADNVFAATPKNEVLYAFKHKSSTDEDWAPVVMLQTRNDIDVTEELEAYIQHCIDDNVDEVDALMDLFEIGYTLEDFKYNNDRYEWACRVAEGHGLA